jgi:hypothetical protein
LKESEKAKMESLEKQDITIGNGTTKTPILASENAPTEAKSLQPQEAASIESSSTSKQTNGTKPLTLNETVSLLQTDCFDAREFGCKVAILARDGKIYIAIEHPEHKFGFDTGKGNITVDGVPVSK